MKSFHTLLFTFALPLSSLASEEPVVLLDSWWNTDYAKLSCKQLAPAQSLDSCLLELKQFERELTTQFAASGECRAVHVAVYEGPAHSPSERANTAALGPHWSLSLNFIPGHVGQRWAMVKSRTTEVTEGEGRPNQIATDVCRILRERGATIER